MCYAWANFGERGDPPEYNTPEGPELIEQGEVFDRPYEERQRFPADAEATEGMGRITVHANENLAPSDKGVALMRRAFALRDPQGGGGRFADARDRNAIRPLADLRRRHRAHHAASGQRRRIRSSSAGSPIA